MIQKIKSLRFFIIPVVTILFIFFCSEETEAKRKKNKKTKKASGVSKDQLKRFNDLYGKVYTIEEGTRRDPFVCPVQLENDKNKKDETNETKIPDKNPAVKTEDDKEKQKLEDEKNKKNELVRLKKIYEDAKTQVEKYRKIREYEKAEGVINEAVKDLKLMEETKKWRSELETLLKVIGQEKAVWVKFNKAMDEINITGKIISSDRSVAIINGKCLLPGSKIGGIELDGLVLSKLTKEEAVFRYKDLVKIIKFNEE